MYLQIVVHEHGTNDVVLLETVMFVGMMVWLVELLEMTGPSLTEKKTKRLFLFSAFFLLKVEVYASVCS